MLRPPSSTLFPYTTLFRSAGGDRRADARLGRAVGVEEAAPGRPVLDHGARAGGAGGDDRGAIGPGRVRQSHKRGRSEEHTSELQSQFHLVCRLLLEKKKKK